MFEAARDDDIELLLAGGTVTTSSLVSQAMIWLYQHQDVRQRLIDQPELRERATEEFLRYFSPTQALARTVTTDVEFHRCSLQAGDRVLLAWASANRDPAGGFDDPDELDIERWPNRHVAFGVGVHRCVGSHIARARIWCGRVTLTPAAVAGTSTMVKPSPSRASTE